MQVPKRPEASDPPGGSGTHKVGSGIELGSSGRAALALTCDPCPQALLLHPTFLKQGLRMAFTRLPLPPGAKITSEAHIQTSLSEWLVLLSTVPSGLVCAVCAMCLHFL